MNKHQSASDPQYQCFRCQSGCIHLVCGNATLTLTRDQFLILADTVNATRSLVLEDVKHAAPSGFESNVVM